MLAAGIAQSRLHWATFVINIMASVALVYVYKLSPEKSTLQLLLATGICGGWSTFSTFSYETVRLIQEGRELEALAYVLGSVMISIAAIWLLVK
jgi:CrcB protein